MLNKASREVGGCTTTQPFQFYGGFAFQVIYQSSIFSSHDGVVVCWGGHSSDRKAHSFFFATTVILYGLKLLERLKHRFLFFFKHQCRKTKIVENLYDYFLLSFLTAILLCKEIYGLLSELVTKYLIPSFHSFPRNFTF